MEGFWSDYPFWGAWVLLFVVGFLRGQATYGLARLAAARTARHLTSTRARIWLAEDTTHPGKRFLARVGLPAISLCYLTVGFQTVVLIAAGVIGISWPKFSLAQLPGVTAWATIYSTVGFAAWTAAARAAAGNYWPLLTLAVLATAATLGIWSYRRRAPRSQE